MIIKNLQNFLFAFVLFCLSISCHRESKIIPIEDFIFRSEKSNFKLSPDGKRIAYLGIHDHCKNIFILDLTDENKSKQLTYQADLNVQSFSWVNDDVIIFSNTQSHEDVLRMFTVEVASEKINTIIEPTKRRLKLLQPVQDFGGSVYGTMNIRDSNVFDLFRIYLDGRAPELVYQNPGNITSWIPSKDGVIRLALTNDSAQTSILYRFHAGESFESVRMSDFKTTIEPLGYVGNSTTNVVALSNENRDKLVIVEYNVAEGREVRELYNGKDLDVNHEGYDVRNRQLLYTSSNTDKKAYTFFSDKMEKVYEKLSDKFSSYSVDFVDYDKVLENFIVRVYSDVHPGDLYYYNFSKNKTKLLTVTYPSLEDVELRPMEHVKYNARDNREIHGYITYPQGKRKDCPLVVLVHDGPSRRDEWGFQSEVQFLANRGYAVFQVNYRGTLGYGKDFWSAGFKEWGGRMQSDITDGVLWLIHRGIADKNRLAIMGTGFGGYSALHAACFNPSMYQCAISSSGYTNMFTYFREIPPYLKPYVQMYYQIIGNPETETDLFKAISPVFHADKVVNPVLVFQGGKDKFTSVTDVNQFVSKLKQNNVPVRYIFKEGEGRRFKQEENMMLYYQEIEAFLAKHLN